ncbi:class I adenylate-forming enzyme family protein [Cerasicoccus fimbriatus]|uniref:class I adenylate-forming enzyme family protein n=1 Tax=Cerasicoccus fimbriatus TaxID=3014554 RepID=UPI0022B50FCA|nr:AMP-binding protein [Cerasicoccus sp. TK19100]
MKTPLTDRWAKLLKQDAGALAVIEDGQHWTRAQLHELAMTKLELFRLQNLKRKAVALHLPNSVEWLATFLALRWAGAVVAPIDGVADTAFCRQQATATRCFAMQSKSLEILDQNARGWKDGIALLKLTSGTSGNPKAFAFTEAELCADADNIISTMGLRSDDVNFALLPFAHSYALGNLVVPLLAAGIPMAIGSAALPRVIADEIAQHGATVFPSVPRVFESIARTEGIRLGKLRLCISAAAPLPAELANEFNQHTGLLIHNFYGASECGGIAYDRSGELGQQGESIGQAMDNVTLSTDSHGRLTVTSAAVSSYRRTTNPRGHAKITLQDKVTIRNDGSIVIRGRSDRIVKCAGRRIDLSSIENIALQAGDVKSAAALHDEITDKLLIAYEGKINEAELRSHLADKFQPWRSRFKVKCVPQLPVNARGKVDRRKLKRQF